MENFNVICPGRRKGSPLYKYPHISYTTQGGTLLIVKPYIKRLDYDIQEMLQLRRDGWSLLRLAVKYNRSHCTILYHCKRAGAEPTTPTKRTPKELLPERCTIFKKKIKRKKPGDKYLDLIDEPQAKTKSYKEYLAESRQRATEKDYYDTFGEAFHMPKEWRL